MQLSDTTSVGLNLIHGVVLTCWKFDILHISDDTAGPSGKLQSANDSLDDGFKIVGQTVLFYLTNELNVTKTKSIANLLLYTHKKLKQFSDQIRPPYEFKID